MRRISLLALTATAIVVFPANTLASGSHRNEAQSAKQSPAASYKSGTYSGTLVSHGSRYFFGLRLANGKVSLRNIGPIECGTQSYPPIGSFEPPRKLSAAGSVTEHASTHRKLPEEKPLTGSSTFAVTFTKHGTATGYLEVSLMGEFHQEPFSCTGKVPFTAKLSLTLAGKPIRSTNR